MFTLVRFPALSFLSTSAHVANLAVGPVLKESCILCSLSQAGQVHQTAARKQTYTILPICLSFLCTYFLYGPQFSNVINRENSKQGKIGINRGKSPTLKSCTKNKKMYAKLVVPDRYSLKYGGYYLLANRLQQKHHILPLCFLIQLLLNGV